MREVRPAPPRSCAPPLDSERVHHPGKRRNITAGAGDRVFALRGAGIGASPTASCETRRTGQDAADTQGPVRARPAREPAMRLDDMRRDFHAGTMRFFLHPWGRLTTMRASGMMKRTFRARFGATIR